MTHRTASTLFRPLARALLSSALLVSSLAGSPAALSATDADRAVRVGVYENAPKIYLDESGNPAGLFITLLREIAREEHWHLVFIRCEWEHCLESLRAGEIDLMPDVAFSQARSQLYSFHHIPVTHSWSVILTPADKPVLSLQELDQRRIALLAGAIQAGPLDRIMTGSRLRYTPIGYPSYADAFAAVRDGDADAVVSNSYYAGFFARQYGLRETPVVFNPTPLFFATTRGDPLHLLSYIDTHLEQWRYDDNSVYYHALKNAMVPAQEAVTPPLLRYFLAGLSGLLLLILALSGLLRWQVQRKTAQLRETAQRLDHMLQASPVVLYQLSMDAQQQVSTRWVSENIERLLGFSAERFISEDLWPRLLHPQDRETVLGNLAMLPETGHLVQEYRLLDARGDTRFIRDEMRFLATGPGQEDEIVGSWNDLTESREQAARLNFLTHYDPLTRLPNRTLLRERLIHTLYRARREQRPLAVLFIDIDRFKHINDSLGHAVGDTVLGAVATRLEQLRHSGDLLARIAGDGFVLLMENNAGQHGAMDMARAVIGHFAEPLHLAEQEVALTLSVGISLYPDDGDDADSLLQHAEAAMYAAKNTGRNSLQLYSASMSEGLEERLSLESALRCAASNGELLLHYQPQLDLDSGRLIGVEALVRWQHPELGLVAPARFIPIAEEMGIIGELGAWVLEEACRQLMDWRSQGLSIPRVAVNLSAQQIDDETLIPMVRDILDRTGLPATDLELEVTESMIMREPEKATAALQGFRAMGIQLAIDDFGTGYSSLSYLKHLPINRLKIDQSFVRDIGRDANSEAISRAVIGLARSLELETVAEGIEEPHQLDFLRREGCLFGQGYLFSRPVDAAGLAAFRQALEGKPIPPA